MNYWAISLSLLMGIACTSISKSDDDANSKQSSDQAARCADLVQQLGDEQFATRERATLELIEIGLPATDALQIGTRHPDREIRFRSERILAIIGELDFESRLEAFTAGRDNEHGLPGWDSFRDAFGGDKDARALFVDMQKTEPDVMRSLEATPQEVSKTVEARCQQLQSLQRLTRQPVPLGSVIALLFAIRNEKVAVNLQTGSALGAFCYQTELQTAMNDAKQRKVLSRLLGDWIRRGDGWNAYQCLTIAMRYDLKEGLIPARQVLENPGNQPYIRQNGVLVIAKLGDKSDFPLLESLLDDESRCASQRVNDKTYETQLRDVALTALLIMNGQNPADFGFDRIQRNEMNVFITSTVGFADKEKRLAALEKWKEYRKTRDAADAKPQSTDASLDDDSPQENSDDPNSP